MNYYLFAKVDLTEKEEPKPFVVEEECREYAEDFVWLAVPGAQSFFYKMCFVQEITKEQAEKAKALGWDVY